MSKNFLASLCLGVSIVLFTVAFADPAYGNSNDESCKGGCEHSYPDDGSCIGDQQSDQSCSGKIGDKNCACHTVTRSATNTTTCECNTGYNGI